MNRKAKHLLYLLIIGKMAIIIGAHHKVNGNPNASYTLAGGLAFITLASIGLIILYLPKLKLLFKQNGR